MKSLRSPANSDFFGKVRFGHAGEFTFDAASGQLRRGDRLVELSGTASEVLRVLLEERPRMVLKDELVQRVWRGTAVEEGGLSVYVAKLRDALSDDPHAPRFIRTFHGKGYAFVADVEPAEAPRRDGSAASAFMLDWERRLFPLTEGENIVGRSPLHCSLCIDDNRVSKRHARIVVTGESAVVEDLKSTNHTFVRGVRIGSPHPLTDGDVIRFGGPDVTFRRTDVPTVQVAPPGRQRRTRS